MEDLGRDPAGQVIPHIWNIGVDAFERVCDAAKVEVASRCAETFFEIVFVGDTGTCVQLPCALVLSFYKML